jgi:hypothetical protein
MLGCVVLLIITPAALAQIATISGTVTEFAGKKAPLRGVLVEVYFESGFRVGSATTEANGTYVVHGLKTENYRVQFSVAGFATQYYLGKSSFARADPVVVMDPVSKPGINAALTVEPPKGSSQHCVPNSVWHSSGRPDAQLLKRVVDR